MIKLHIKKKNTNLKHILGDSEEAEIRHPSCTRIHTYFSNLIGFTEIRSPIHLHNTHIC